MNWITWTRQKPNDPGWYWCENTISGFVEIIEFRQGGDGAQDIRKLAVALSTGRLLRRKVQE